MRDELKLLNKELSDTFEELGLTYAETSALYCLKNYIDKRFEILEEKLCKTN